MFPKDESSYKEPFCWTKVMVKFLTPLIYDCPLVKVFWVQGPEFITEVTNTDLDLPLPLVVLLSASLLRDMDANVENVLKCASTKILTNWPDFSEINRKHTGLSSECLTYE